MPALNEEQRILQAAWKRALKEGSIRLPQATKQQAARLRMMLYTTAQKAKREPHLDYELADAVSECFITLEDKVLIIMRKSATPMMQGLKEALGLSAEELKPKEASASAEEDEVLGNLFRSPLAGLITKE